MLIYPGRCLSAPGRHSSAVFTAVCLEAEVLQSSRVHPISLTLAVVKRRVPTWRPGSSLPPTLAHVPAGPHRGALGHHPATAAGGPAATHHCPEVLSPRVQLQAQLVPGLHPHTGQSVRSPGEARAVQAAWASVWLGVWPRMVQGHPAKVKEAVWPAPQGPLRLLLPHPRPAGSH